MCVRSFILIGYCVSELHGHICPYRNVWPEAVYYTRSTMFTECLHVCVIRVRGCYHITKFVTLNLMVSEIAIHCLRLCIVVLQELHCLHVFMIRVRGCFSANGASFLTLFRGALLFCRYSSNGASFLTLFRGALLFCRYSSNDASFLTLFRGALLFCRYSSNGASFLTLFRGALLFLSPFFKWC